MGPIRSEMGGKKNRMEVKSPLGTSSKLLEGTRVKEGGVGRRKGDQARGGFP